MGQRFPVLAGTSVGLPIALLFGVPVLGVIVYFVYLSPSELPIVVAVMGALEAVARDAREGDRGDQGRPLDSALVIRDTANH